MTLSVAHNQVADYEKGPDDPANHDPDPFLVLTSGGEETPLTHRI